LFLIILLLGDDKRMQVSDS